MADSVADNMADHKADSSASSNLQHMYFFINEVESPVNQGNATLSSLHPFAQRGSSSKQSSAVHSPFSTGSLNPLAKDFIPYEAPNQALPKQHPQQRFVVLQIANKGKGLFATEFIPRGAEIIREKSILSIPDDGFHHAWPAYLQMSNAQKEIFDELYVVQLPERMGMHETSLGMIDPIADPSAHLDLVPEIIRVMSIFALNYFEVAENNRAIFPRAARLNHSCLPNVHSRYNPTLDAMTVYALRDIYPGDEILTNYLAIDGSNMVCYQRLSRLQSSYLFSCQCPACSDITGASDARRALIANLSWGLYQFCQMGVRNPHGDTAFVPNDLPSALVQAEDWITTLRLENLCGLELARAYRVASTLALDAQDFERATEYAEHERIVERFCFGPDLKHMNGKNGSGAECWVRTVYAYITEVAGHVEAKRLRGLAKKGKNVFKRSKYLDKKAAQGEERNTGNSVYKGRQRKKKQNKGRKAEQNAEQNGKNMDEGGGTNKTGDGV